MKYIEVDEELYRHIASKTERIGESASDILRRVLGLQVTSATTTAPSTVSHPSLEPVPAKAKIQSKPIVNVNKLINPEQLAAQKGAVGRFLFILDAIYQVTSGQFEQILLIQGRGRLYFATSKEALLISSKTANPKEIGKSGFWVTTNNNTAKKRKILSEVLLQFGISELQIDSIIEQV